MDNNNKTKLPLTHYDRVLKNRPLMWEFIQKDIAYIIGGSASLPIASVDDFSDENLSAYADVVVSATIQDIATSTGLPIKEIIPIARQLPQTELLLQGVVADYHNILNFELFGRKAFFFHCNLSDHLLATELSVDSELLKLPVRKPSVVYSIFMENTANEPTQKHPRYAVCAPTDLATISNRAMEQNRISRTV